MAGTSFSPFKHRFVLAPAVLLLFTPPIFSMLVFFWPLIVSTLLGVLAVVSFGKQGGIPTLQEKDTFDRAGVLVLRSRSDVADTQKISDVLMVGNEEVTWLEWLHNEDMEKCHAQGDANCVPVTWDLDELDVAHNQHMEKYDPQRHGDGLPGRRDLDELDVARIEDMEKFHAHGHAACMLGKEDLDELDVAGEASVCTLALRSEKKSTVDVHGSVITDESFASNVANDMIAVSLNAMWHNATVKLCEENCLFPSQTSKVTSTRDATNVFIRKEGIPSNSDTEALMRHGMRRHTLGEDTKERDSGEANEGAIHKGHAEERDCGEHNRGFIGDANDNEENKSCLRFSFFDNGGLTLNANKA